jgi:ribosomal protein S12 methylthiotransferase
MRTKSLKKNKINVITLGCSKNIYDSEVLMGQLVQAERMLNMKLLQKAKEISSLLIRGFIDNAKAESVNMILEYADKEEDL